MLHSSKTHFHSLYFCGILYAFSSQTQIPSLTKSSNTASIFSSGWVTDPIHDRIHSLLPSPLLRLYTLQSSLLPSSLIHPFYLTCQVLLNLHLSNLMFHCSLFLSIFCQHHNLGSRHSPSSIPHVINRLTAFKPSFIQVLSPLMIAYFYSIFLLLFKAFYELPHTLLLHFPLFLKIRLPFRL